MRTIGMIGGTSWESTQEYYKLINQETSTRLGSKHSARIIMYSFDFEEIWSRLQQEDFDGIGLRMREEALKLQNAGAELLMLCANTAHRWADMLTSSLEIPLVHIGDPVGRAIQACGIHHVLLLGTQYTMEGDFLKQKLQSEYDLKVSIPGIEDRKLVNRIIFDELIAGVFKDESRESLLQVIKNHPEVEGVILGCTELPLIIQDRDCHLPFFNTTRLHAHAVVDKALK